MNEIDPYVVLGVSRRASSADVRIAYEQLSQRLKHNIQYTSNNAGSKKQLEYAEAAYKVLSDNISRRHYDNKHPISLGTENTLSLRTVMSKRSIETLLEPQVVYLYLEIAPNTSVSTDAPIDPPINLTLVLDHSNSMDGMRLDRVKVAATEIIDQLSEKDFLSVVGFNDRAEVIIPATPVKEKKKLASRARMTRASGGTEIFQGLQAGIEENRKNLQPDRINHIILLTDGKTYGDQDKCIAISRSVTSEGIGISTLGLGSEWNDKFLDEIASITGGTSGFIRSANSVVSFMNNHLKKLANIYAERLQLTIATQPGIDVEMLFKIKPSPQPLSHLESPIMLGGLEFGRKIGILVQMQIAPKIDKGFKPLARIMLTGGLMGAQHPITLATEIAAEITEEPSIEEPPDEILDALGKLTLYRMQERAQEATERGDIVTATRSLQNLATRLMEIGEDDLAQEALNEMRRLEQTHQLSDEGQKALKYQTRYLINPDADD